MEKPVPLSQESLFQRKSQTFFQKWIGLDILNSELLNQLDGHRIAKLSDETPAGESPSPQVSEEAEKLRTM